VVFDGALNTENLQNILSEINSLDDDKATSKFIHKNPNEYNKYAFTTHYGRYLTRLFEELNSHEFISILEKLTGITGLIRNDTTLQGAGVHRIHPGGYLSLHTDFNSYRKDEVKLDRRINLLIYMNPEWQDSYGGKIWLCDKEKKTCVKKVSPLLNRCVIFNTSNKSIHGHPEPLSVPENLRRQSIAVYYYTKNTNGSLDFEGDPEHSTVWYSPTEFS
jgi:Rps23 Pro-64 3,4-dihydroxylase Tpa1-like proline 4-hydroxylase